MQLIEIPLDQIRVSGWNPNKMNDAMVARLCKSIDRFGFVVPLVVRMTGEATYETVGGAHRLLVLQELGFIQASCVVVQIDDAHARLLAQSLNVSKGKMTSASGPDL